MVELKLQQTKLKGSVPPRVCFHESKQMKAYLGMKMIPAWVCTFIVKKTKNKQKNKAKGIAPGVINNVNLLFPLYGDKGVIFIFN